MPKDKAVTRVRVAFELPKELRAQVEKMAAVDDRSLSAEIRQLLVWALEQRREKSA